MLYTPQSLQMLSEKRVLHIAQDGHWTLEIGGPGGRLIGDWRLVREDWRLESGRQQVFRFEARSRGPPARIPRGTPRRDMQLFEYRSVRYWSKEINGALTGGRKK